MMTYLGGHRNNDRSSLSRHHLTHANSRRVSLAWRAENARVGRYRRPCRARLARLRYNKTYDIFVYSFLPRAWALTLCANSTSCSSRRSPAIFCSYVMVTLRPATITSSVASVRSERTLEMIGAGSTHHRLVYKSLEETGLCGDECDFAKVVVLAKGEDSFG